MTKVQALEKARSLRQQMAGRRSKVEASLSDLVVMLICIDSRKLDRLFETRLYRKHGAEYCEYLSLLQEMQHIV